MIVIAGGMIRSGSTFAFNVIRELLARTGKVRTFSVNHLEESEWNPSSPDHVLVKSHSPDARLLSAIANGSAPCVCTARRPEDAIASWSRAFGFPLEHGIEMVRTWRDWHDQVRDKVLTVEYKLVDENPGQAARTIAEFLKIEADPDWFDHLLQKYEKLALKNRLDALANDEKTVDIGFSYYDKETFFHRRHISSERSDTAENLLTSEQLDTIRAALGTG